MDEYITKLGTLYQIPPSAESLQFCKVPIDPENSTSTTVHTGSQQLTPVLLQCFAIILLGYLTGRFGLISPSESRGLNTFLSYFSLPSAIFLALATLNIDSINWNLFISLLVSKSIVFLLVAILTLIIRWPNGAGRAGLYAIFCTQSNDFALGFPIISALYDQTHPEFPDYLYLAVPISLAILNPNRLDNDGILKTKYIKSKPFSQSDVPQVKRSKGTIILKVVLNLCSAPIFFMTVLGLIVKLTVADGIPLPVYGILRLMSSAFVSIALFMLGLTMVGKIHTLSNRETLMTSFMLVVGKTLILPLIAKQVTLALVKCNENGTSTCGYANFAYLYGTVPTAPTVFVYASTFQTSVEIISSGIVAGTLFSAPLMLAASTFINSHSMKNLQQLKDSFETKDTFNTISSATWIPLEVQLRPLNTFSKQAVNSLGDMESPCLTPFSNLIIFALILQEFTVLIALPTIPSNVISFLVFIGKYLFYGITALAVLSLHLRSFCFAVRTRAILIVLGLTLCIIITLIRFEHLIATGIILDHFEQIGVLSFKNLGFTISLAFLAIPIGFSIFLHFMRSYKELRKPEDIQKSVITEVTSSAEISNMSLKNQIMCDHFGICPREKKRKEFSFSVYENIKKRNSVVTQLLGNLKLSIREPPVTRSTNTKNELIQPSARIIKICHGHSEEEEIANCERRMLEQFNTTDLETYNADEYFELMSHISLFESVGGLITGAVTSTWYAQVYFNTIFSYIVEIIVCLLYGLDYYATIYPIHKLENEKVYKVSFYGKNLISWICKRYAITDRKEATMYAQTLLDIKIIKSRKRSCCFVDSIQLYKFSEDVD
ncbi:Integral membrane protein GPR155 [Nymphon striatum]|nr:Integral membrane protein GPR155 [Nymphon striatum]